MSTTTPETAPLTVPDYPSDYVEIPFETDAQALADDAVENLQATWLNWVANDGDLEVVLIETLSAMAAVAAANAAAVPPAALIALGTKLYGIAYQEGVPATTTVTLTFIDGAGGYSVPSGSEFEMAGYAFTTVDDQITTPGQTQITGVAVVAGDVGVAYNDLTSADWASVTLPVWVSDLATEAPTSEGVDPQDDNDYLNMVSRELQLRGRIVVTLPDYELVAVNTPGVGRAYAVTDDERNVQVYLTDPYGEPVSEEIKDGLAATYATERLVNVTVALLDATYDVINVSYSVVALPGFDPVALQASIDQILAQTLSPMGFGTVATGQPGTGPVNWLGGNTIHSTKLVAVIGNAPGVAYVVANSVSINGQAADADYVMPGAVALPQPGTFTGTVTLS